MRPRTPRALVACALLGALAACGQGLRERLPGVYVLDRETYRREALERLREAQTTSAETLVGPARRAFERRLGEEADAQAAAVRLRLDLADDGTFRVVFRYGDEQGHGRGTWVVRDSVVRLRTTEQNGRPLAQPPDATGTLEDGRLRLEGAHVPVPMPLLRAAAP